MSAANKEFRRSAQVVYLSTLPAGNYFAFCKEPDHIYQVLRKNEVVTIIESATGGRQKRHFYPAPKDNADNRVMKIILQPGQRKPGEPDLADRP